MPELEHGGSARLVRAARAELDRLARHQARIDQRLASLDQERGLLRAEARALADREALLRRLIGDAPALGDRGDNAIVLRGARLRIEATRILWEHHRSTPVHYRDWFQLVGNAGFVVLAKRPLAAFLTNVTRSAIVRGARQPGVYFIDIERTAELRQDLAERQTELRDLAGVMATEPNRSVELQVHRTRLLAGIRRLERAIAEADAALRSEAVAS